MSMAEQEQGQEQGKKQSEIYQGKAIKSFGWAARNTGVAVVSGIVLQKTMGVASLPPVIGGGMVMGMSIGFAFYNVGKALEHTLSAHRAAGREEAAEAQGARTATPSALTPR